jgi:hypothetical protein
MKILQVFVRLLCCLPAAVYADIEWSDTESTAFFAFQGSLYEPLLSAEYCSTLSNVETFSPKELMDRYKNQPQSMAYKRSVTLAGTGYQYMALHNRVGEPSENAKALKYYIFGLACGLGTTEALTPDVCRSPAGKAKYIANNRAGLLYRQKLYPLGADENVDTVLADNVNTNCHMVMNPPNNAFASPYTRANFWCKADWDSKCEGTEYISIAKKDRGHLQACRVEYREVTRGKKHNDGEKPKQIGLVEADDDSMQFIGYKFRLYAEGTYNLFDRESAKMEYTNIVLYTIPRHAAVKERKKAGCDIPKRRSVPVQLPPQEPSNLKPITVSWVELKPHKIRVTLKNPNSARATVYLNISYDSKFYGQRITKHQGITTLNPKVMHNFDVSALPKDATNWIINHNP